MKAQDFLKRFPETRPKNDCLYDRGCPECGQRDALQIVIQAAAVVTDGGVDVEGDQEWDEDSVCLCPDCEHTGIVIDFTHDGLDELLTKKGAR